METFIRYKCTEFRGDLINFIKKGNNRYEMMERVYDADPVTYIPRLENIKIPGQDEVNLKYRRETSGTPYFSILLVPRYELYYFHINTRRMEHSDK